MEAFRAAELRSQRRRGGPSWRVASVRAVAMGGPVRGGGSTWGGSFGGGEELSLGLSHFLLPLQLPSCLSSLDDSPCSGPGTLSCLLRVFFHPRFLFSSSLPFLSSSSPRSPLNEAQQAARRRSKDGVCSCFSFLATCFFPTENKWATMFFLSTTLPFEHRPGTTRTLRVRGGRAGGVAGGGVHAGRR